VSDRFGGFPILGVGLVGADGEVSWIARRAGGRFAHIRDYAGRTIDFCDSPQSRLGGIECSSQIFPFGGKASDFVFMPRLCSGDVVSTERSPADWTVGACVVQLLTCGCSRRQPAIDLGTLTNELLDFGL
jgi:hypothetical protein